MFKCRCNVNGFFFLSFKDKQYGKITTYYAHNNPDASVETQITPYKQYTLGKAYRGESFFWGLLPQPGDYLKFKFVHPIFIKKYVLLNDNHTFLFYFLMEFLIIYLFIRFRYLFRSGNPEHPLDQFYNTTVQVLPVNSKAIDRNRNDVTEDGYLVIGCFLFSMLYFFYKMILF